MSLTAIRAALETRLNAMAPAVAIAWENRPFQVPAPTVPYQQVNILFATPENPETGAGYRELGIFQVSLLYPLGDGANAAGVRATAIRTQFPKNLALTSGGVVVTISKTPSIGGGAVDGDRWRLPIKISFFSNQFG